MSMDLRSARSIGSEVVLFLGALGVLQLGGCIGSLIPAALSLAEQSLLRSILGELLLL